MQRRRFSHDGQFRWTGARQCDRVQCHAGQVVQQGAETVQWKPFRGAPGGQFAAGGGRPFGRGDGGGAGVGGRPVIVFKQQRCQPAAQVPFEIICQHAQEHMAADMVFGVDEDGAQPQFGFGGAEGAFDGGQAFVCRHGGVGIKGVGRQTGADHIQAVKAGFVVNVECILVRYRGNEFSTAETEVMYLSRICPWVRFGKNLGPREF